MTGSSWGVGTLSLIAVRTVRVLCMIVIARTPGVFHGDAYAAGRVNVELV